MILLFEAADPQSIPRDCQVFKADVASGEPLTAQAVEGFFDRRIKFGHLLRAHRRPWYFDLAVIGPDVRLGLRRRILSQLKATAHARSVVLLLRRPTSPWRRRRSLKKGLHGLARVFRGLEAVGVTSDTPALLLGDIDKAIERPHASWMVWYPRLWFATRKVQAFLDRHRIENLTIATGQQADDAPCYEDEAIEPVYREIGRSPDLFRHGVGLDQRAVGLWWGKPLRLLDASVSIFEQVSYIPSDGLNEAILIDGTGQLLPASHRWEAGYGPSAQPNIETPPALVIGRDGRRMPLGSAADLRSRGRAQGEFFLLGFLDPRFGHFIVETLAGAWAIDWALARGMRVLVWGQPREFHRQGLRLLGIPDERLTFAAQDVAYERLHVPTPAFRMLGSISRAAGRTWQTMADRAMLSEKPDCGPDGDAARFLFLSRAGSKLRKLTNGAELEAFMESRGGVMLRPETLSFDDQVRTAHRASTIVGCFGSQLHLSMFQRPGGRRLVIGSEQFTGPEETLIGIANDTRVDYYLQPAPRRGSRKARTASWAIDMDRFAPAFDRWLAEDKRAQE